MMRWIASQLAGLILRRRSGPTNDTDPAGVASDDVRGGFTLQWNASRESNRAGQPRQGLTWTFESAPVASRIFKIDEAQLQDARAAHDSGATWEQISRQVNPEYDNLDGLEQEFYRRALQMAVEEGGSSGPATSPND